MLNLTAYEDKNIIYTPRQKPCNMETLIRAYEGPDEEIDCPCLVINPENPFESGLVFFKENMPDTNIVKYTGVPNCPWGKVKGSYMTEKSITIFQKDEQEYVYWHNDIYYSVILMNYYRYRDEYRKCRESFLENHLTPFKVISLKKIADYLREKILDVNYGVHHIYQGYNYLMEYDSLSEGPYTTLLAVYFHGMQLKEKLDPLNLIDSPAILLNMTLEEILGRKIEMDYDANNFNNYWVNLKIEGLNPREKKVMLRYPNLRPEKYWTFSDSRFDRIFSLDNCHYENFVNTYIDAFKAD